VSEALRAKQAREGSRGCIDNARYLREGEEAAAIVSGELKEGSGWAGSSCAAETTCAQCRTRCASTLTYETCKEWQREACTHCTMPKLFLLRKSRLLQPLSLPHCKLSPI
jgi:hypothetical protein